MAILKFSLRFLIAFFGIASWATAADQPELKLWYDKAAGHWTEALPVGNGSLGGMVYGGPGKEQVQFNEDTLWTGSPHDYSHPGAVEVLPELRRLLEEGRQKDAEALGMERFMSQPLRQKSYQPFGDLYLEFPGHETPDKYRRELDLRSALSTVRYEADGVAYTRTAFSSYPDKVLVLRIEASRPGALDFRVNLGTAHANYEVEATDENCLLLSGKVEDLSYERMNPEEAAGYRAKYEDFWLRFAARVSIEAEGGSVRKEGDALVVSGATSATLRLCAATSFVNYEDVSGDPLAKSAALLGHAESVSYETLLARHLADYQELFGRVELDLGTSLAASMTTDARLRANDKTSDTQLATLLFQYGRYLLISSSRPGSQPANLQGIWNDQLRPPWDSKYTMNINAEMNYWPTEVANLAECAEPFFDLIDEVAASGSRTAKVHYGARGWVLHHNTDIWRGTAPINNSNHGIWPSGGAWLCRHLWERYLFFRDESFLRDRAYPIMRDSAQFFLDTLVRDAKTGWLISGPSNSPEHGGLVMGPTMDHQIIGELFAAVAEAAAILKTDDAFAAAVSKARSELAPNQIGRHGQLQEWLEDKDDPANKHRHVSHLWGVFPGSSISTRTPELLAAAKQSLEFRGDGGTGWSLGWKINLWARFQDGDRAHQIVMNQLAYVDPGYGTSGGGGMYPNLFDAHPPFQIDGNFAATAGIAEMLVQSHALASAQRDDPEIVLLPALPKAWPKGSFKGLRARGGFVLELSWEDGALKRLVVGSEKGGTARLRYGGRVVDIQIKAGETVELGPGLRNQMAYDGSKSALDLARWMVDSSVSRFKEWVPAGQSVPARWDYALSIVADACLELSEATGEPVWQEYAEGIIGPCIEGPDTIRGHRMADYNIDMVKPGSAALALYQKTGEERYLWATQLLRQQLREQPRTSEGGFWHKEKYTSQMWLDGLYMGAPFYAAYGLAFDDKAALDDAVHQLELMDKRGYDAKSGLYYHAWDEKKVQAWANPDTGLSANFWSRALGWYGMALVDVLAILPEEHPRRAALLEILKRWADGVARYQDEASGLWWQVTDHGDYAGNYLEGTASAMFVFTFAKAINHEFLKEFSYGKTLDKAWAGVTQRLLDVDASGRLNLAQCCRVAGLSDDRDGSVEYYLRERVIFNDLKGVGPFIRACLQMEQYENKRASR